MRALLLEQHPDEQQHGRDRGQAEHQPPVGRPGQPVVDEVGHQDPGRDRELVEADQAAADPGRHDLADVERHHHRGRPDRQADHDPRDQQHREGRGERRQQHADHEDGGRDQDRQAPADQVRHPPRQQRADHRADQQQAGDQLFLEGGEPAEVLLDEQQRPRHHPGVVAEQQPAESGHPRAERDMPAHLLRGSRVPRHQHHDNAPSARRRWRVSTWAFRLTNDASNKLCAGHKLSGPDRDRSFGGCGALPARSRLLP